MVTKETPPAVRWHRHLILVAVVALAAGLRFYRIGHQSFWNDEGTSVALAGRSLGLILEGASHDIHPPLYYLLLHVWMRLLGPSEAAVRSLSALLGIATVGATYTLTERTWGRTAALLAALLATIAPFQVHYAQEARMYMLATTLACASMAAWHKLMTEHNLERHRCLRQSVAYLVITVLLTYTHYTGFTVVLAQNVAVLWWLVRLARRDRTVCWRVISRWVALQLALGALYTPWLALSWRALTQWPAVGHADGLISLARSALQALTLGTALQPQPWLLVLGFAGGAVALLGILFEIRRRSRAPIWSLYLLVPLVSMGLYSLVRPMFKPKFALLVAPALAALQAVAISTLADLGKRRWGGVAGVLLGIGVTAMLLASSGAALWQQYHDPSTFRDDYRGIVAYIEAVAGPDDAILINAPSQIETVDLYASGRVPAYPLPLQRPLDQEITRAHLNEIVTHHAKLYGIFWATDESDPDRFIEGWLDHHAYRAMDAWFGNLRLVVYTTTDAAVERSAQEHACRLGDRIHLERHALAPVVTSGDILQVELTWRTAEPITHRFRVFLHLVDAQGQIVAQRDAEPVGFGRPTDSWEVGETIIDRHGIMIRPATPPGSYALIVGMYDPATGQRLPVACDRQPESDVVALGEVTIERALTPPPLTALDIVVHDDVELQGVRLLGHHLYLAGHAHAPDTPLHPGDTLELVIHWQRTSDASPAHEATFELRDRRQSAQSFTLPMGTETYPPRMWAPDEIVRAVHRVRIKPELAPGRLELWARNAEDRWERIDRFVLAAP